MSDPYDPNDPQTGPHTTEEESWIAQLDRKVSTRTYAGGVALILALAAGIVAIVLALDARDSSAKPGDIRKLEQEISKVSKAAEDDGGIADSLSSVSGRIDSVEDQLGDLSSTDTENQDRIEVLEDDIEDLRQQLSDLENSSSGGSSPSNSDD